MISKILDTLEKTHPLTMLEELAHYTPFQRLVMTLLSARSKDSTTIPIVKELFAQYPTPEDYVSMDLRKLEKLIYGVGFFRVKAKNVKKLSKIIIEKHNGIVPDTLQELTALPGVGRKTANCVLAYVFKKPAIAVDIHVHRISNRLGWVSTRTPEKTEFALMEVVPQDRWIDINRLLVGHGQTLCLPRKPHCAICPVQEWCKYGKKLR